MIEIIQEMCRHWCVHINIILWSLIDFQAKEKLPTVYANTTRFLCVASLLLLLILINNHT